MLTLTEREWRLIHNALAVYQSFLPSRDVQYRKEAQELMDKVRDQAIAVILKEDNDGQEHTTV